MLSASACDSRPHILRVFCCSLIQLEKVDVPLSAHFCRGWESSGHCSSQKHTQIKTKILSNLKTSALQALNQSQKSCIKHSWGSLKSGHMPCAVHCLTTLSVTELPHQCCSFIQITPYLTWVWCYSNWQINNKQNTTNKIMTHIW